MNSHRKGNPFLSGIITPTPSTTFTTSLYVGEKENGDVKIIDKKISKKKKYSEEDVKIINSLKGNKMTYVLETLKTTYEIKTSRNTVRKIWKGEY